MESLGYLGVVPARGLSPYFPKVYYVTGRGVRRLKESLSQRGKVWNPGRVDRRGRDSHEGYTAERIVHELLITEFMLALWQTVEQRSDLELLAVERRSLANHPAFKLVMDNQHTRLIPDAMFLFRYQRASMCCCFLELDNGTMNKKQMRAKFLRYDAWSRSTPGQQYLTSLYERHGAKESRPTFRLLMVTRSRTGRNDDGRLDELLTSANRLPVGLLRRVWMTTVAALCEHQHDERLLDASIWVRSGDPPRPAGSSQVEDEVGQGVRYSLFPATRP
jgi:hypothetical protein